jgi:hypothetical protein
MRKTKLFYLIFYFRLFSFVLFFTIFCTVENETKSCEPKVDSDTPICELRQTKKPIVIDRFFVLSIVQSS